MTNPTSGRFHLALALLFGLGAAAVGLALFSTSDGSQWRLVTSLSQTQAGDGRLFRSSESFPHQDEYRKALVAASLELLDDPDSALHLRMKSLVDISAGEVRAAGELLHRLLEIHPDDPEVLNDLGVVYMALGKENVSNYFRAAQLFERSRRLKPHAFAPSFNAAFVYQKLELDELADQRRHEYLGFDTSRRAPGNAESESSLLNSMQRALAGSDPNLANRFLRGNPSAYRHAALHYVLNPDDDQTLYDASQFILDNFEKADPTVTAILTPLHGPSRGLVIKARKLVSSGMESYRRGKLEEASHTYDLAEEALAGANSPFDNLWVKLNQADADTRMLKSEDAQNLIAEVISESRSRQYRWLLGMALTARNADPTLAHDSEDVLQTLNEAIDMFVSIDATEDAARALNYLAATYFLAGDFEKSLDIAYRTLSFTPKSDHLRRAQLFLMVATEVYRLGLQEYAGPLGEKGLIEANMANNPGLVSFASSNLAMFHALNKNIPAADAYFTIAKTASSQVESPVDRELSEVNINLLCARIRTNSGNLSNAEKCLRQNMEIFRDLKKRIPYLVVQTLLQLGETHALGQQFHQAHQDFQEAADFLETDDVYLAAGVLRMAFENERRNFYEKAIAFEYAHGNKDKAWEYVQRYRSKLFLEFLGQLNPDVDTIRSAAIDRNKIQQQIPPGVQVLEYVILPDRVLIWLVSNKRFVSTSVPVTRTQLERKVSGLLEGVEAKSQSQHQAQDLHRLLIEPIEDQLDPASVLVIVPDQALHRLNFPALYSETKKSFLIERYTILENPSLTSLLSAAPGTPARTKVVGFGAQSDDTNATAELKALRNDYSDIQSFNGPGAVKQEFLASLVSSSVFHYAGHSQDASDPLRSAILLDGNKEGPNSVTAVDITKHRMPANSVVVLASCDSSVGNSRDGVGIRGLTSAFLISGAGSVVGSLWLVESVSTSRLVLAFHKHFAQDKLPVAEALRKAQIEFIAKGVHPYYWSGFVVTGNVSALR